MTTTAFVYKWTHLVTGKWYIGSRTKVGCHPDDGYICSSKIVKPLITSSPTEWQREILFLGSPKEVIITENVMLLELNAKDDPLSYNMHNGDGKFTTANIVLSEEWKQNISKALTGLVRSDEAKAHYRESNRRKASDPIYLEKLRKPKHPGHGENVSKATVGVKKSKQHCQALSDAKKGVKTGPCSDKRKLAIQAALKGKHTLPLVICPHCGKEGRANMHRWHFENCKRKNQC
jgi:hypothetical protein